MATTRTEQRCDSGRILCVCACVWRCNEADKHRPNDCHTPSWLQFKQAQRAMTMSISAPTTTTTLLGGGKLNLPRVKQCVCVWLISGLIRQVRRHQLMFIILLHTITERQDSYHAWWPVRACWDFVLYYTQTHIVVYDCRFEEKIVRCI